MGGGSSPSPSSPSHWRKKPSTLDWVPLQKHPVFSSCSNPPFAAGDPPGNLAAGDAASSRLYLWDPNPNPNARCIHRLSIRFFFCDSDSGSSSSTVIQAASPSEILMPDIPIKSVIHNISLNANGSSLLLSSSDSLTVINLHEIISSNGNTLTYRMTMVASQIFSGHNGGLQILLASWHPFSPSHLGVLSTDSVLRLFDLSSDLERPEQEFYLQPFEPRSCHNAVSICPVAFSFGDQHLWERFSIFVLFSDGSVYVLCPVIPFGSLCSWAYIEQIHEDVKVFGLKSLNANVISNSNLALAWLESTFPELADQPIEEGDKLVSRAHPYVPLDASLTLQGPLGKVRNVEETDGSRVCGADCEGKAVSFLYSSIGRDSVLVIGWSSGKLQINALADEVQPLWNIGSCPRIHVDSYGRINGVAIICEPYLQELSAAKLNHPSLNISYMADSGWLGHPPFLTLAIVDLALPRYVLDNCLMALFADPLVAERFYCIHGGGVDLISLHFLPFSNMLHGTDKIEEAPSVCPILTTCHDESCSTSALCGFVTIVDSCGQSQIVGITPTYECIVLESRDWTDVTPFHSNIDVKSVGSTETDGIPEVISKELLIGPKIIVVPPLTSLRTLTADSIEGRSTLHQYIKLFHENYVEYAHKVYVELKHHENFLKMIIDDQHKRLCEAKQLFLNVEDKEQGIKNRISWAFKVYELLEQRLQNFRILPSANKKPLSRAERDFKVQLERFADVELDALHSSIEALNARLRRSIQSSPVSTLNIARQTPGRRKNNVSDGKMQQVRSSLELLSGINNENTKKVHLIEHRLKSHEE